MKMNNIRRFWGNPSLSLILIFVSSLAVADNLISRPVGVMRIELNEHETQMIAMPFNPLDSDINAVIGNQLTGENAENLADRILMWDPENAHFIQAFKADGTQTEVDGKWYSEFTNWTPSAIRFTPGKGYWLDSRHDYTQAVYIVGEVILNPTNSMYLHPQVNAIGYPFSTARDVDDTALLSVSNAVLSDPTIQTEPTRLNTGKGYWLTLTNNNVTLWSEIRPYADIFPVNGSPPSIKKIAVQENGIRLTIACSGSEGELLDIYCQDKEPGDSFNTLSGWSLLASNVSTENASTYSWLDDDISDRTALRFYLVGRADIDANANGIPDAREIFLHMGAGVDAPSLSLLSYTNQDISNSNVSHNQLLTNDWGQIIATNVITQSLQMGRIIYVDQRMGDDEFTGRSPVITVNANGPKKTIQEGISASQAGDTIVIKSGEYRENMAVAGKNIKILIKGKVDVSGSDEPIDRKLSVYTNLNGRIITCE